MCCRLLFFLPPMLAAVALCLAACRPSVEPAPAKATTTPELELTAKNPGMIRAHGFEVELIDKTDDHEHHGQLEAWLRRSLHAIADTTGGSPAPLRLVARKGRANGSTSGRTILLALPAGRRPSTPRREWVLHHELVHATFPRLPRADLWLDEGLATYLEPLARVRVGQRGEVQLWQEWARDLPQGARRDGEAGLSGTSAWHRLYWQGAVFWLDAELVIDQRTAGRRSLSDALCAWARAGGEPGEWTAERAFSIMDAALGEAVLVELYRRAAAKGNARQPAELLHQLGVERGTDGRVRLRSDARSTALRARLTAPASARCRTAQPPR